MSAKMPTPFLGSLFEKDVQPTIATGFNYHASEPALHGFKNHNAIDINLPRGTKILAPADGYYVATYGEYQIHNNNGSPRRLSQAGVLSIDPTNSDIRAPSGDKQPIFFGSFV